MSHPPFYDGLASLACFHSELILKSFWYIYPLLGEDLETNNGVMQPVSRQWIGKHVPFATNTHTNIVLLLETVFSSRSVQSGSRSPVSRKRRRKGKTVGWVYNQATLFVGDINTGTWPSRLGESGI
jgi:hypothetical protein